MWYIEQDEEFGAAVESTKEIGFKCRSHHYHDDATNEKENRIDFKVKAKDSSKGLSLFGTVPPPKKLPNEQVSSIATCVAQAICELRPDGVVVYDIQDEPSRNGTERPFPFFQTHEPRVYAKMLEDLAPHSEPIIYRALTPNQTANEFREWLTETVNDYKGKNIVLVGGSCCHDKQETILSVPEAANLIQTTYPDVFLGGITIPERHRDRGNEHTRINDKVGQGVGFFTSQVVYNADSSIWMLKDYDQLCKQQNKDPVRIVFTFAPFGSETTVCFLRWLGVELPDGTVKRVLSKATIKERAEESMEICWENWKRILDCCKRLKIKVPIGFSVESVSKSKIEQDAATRLFSNLKEEMDLYYQTISISGSNKQ